jgi:predicted transcriptional regulator
VIEVAQETLAAEAQTAACIGVPVEEVVAWVLSWDTPDELPTPIARKLD